MSGNCKHEMMAHSSLVPQPAIASLSSPIPSRSWKNAVPVLRFDRQFCFPHSSVDGQKEKAGSAIYSRREFTYGVLAAAIGLTLAPEGANAAARRPPSPPPEEKNDPNVSGVQAKVLASKRRKEAMKEAIAKERERGKQIEQQ